MSRRKSRWATSSRTPAAWAALVERPQDRAGAVQTTAEQLGGRLVSYFYAFGDSDTFVTLELPDDVSAAAVSLAFAASGVFRALTTTRLFTVEEGMEAMRKAGQVNLSYRSPVAGGGRA